MKKWFKLTLNNLANFVASKFSVPRLWSEEEWNSYSSKEKLWILYQQMWFLQGNGSAIVDKFTMPIKEILLYGSIIILTVERLYAMANIEVGPMQLLSTVAIACIVVWTVNFLVQWWLGNEIDKRDLIALNSEIGNKRQIAFRELRKAASQEAWRKEIKTEFKRGRGRR